MFRRFFPAISPSLRVGLSPQGPYLSCEPTLFEKSADKRRLVELEDSTMLDGTTGGLPLLNTRPRGFPGTPWIFSPDFELGKTGQRGVMKKNRLFCYEIPKYSWSFVWKAEESWIPMLCFFVKSHISRPISDYQTKLCISFDSNIFK